MESYLMTDTYRYSELAQQYQNFMVPAYKITIGGKNIVTDCKMYPESISITLSLKSASSVSIKLTGVYDREKSSLSSAAKNVLKLGNTVMVRIGYGSSLELVFKGYIHEVSADFSDTPSISVTAMDVRRLMMDYTVDNYVHTVSTYSDAFESVMKKYKKLANTKVDSTQTIKEGDNAIEGIIQKGSDYEFIHKVLCKVEEREFFVFADMAYYRTPKGNKSPSITLNWGEALISFRKNSLYKDTAIQVLGYSMNKDQVTAKATAVSDSKAVKPISQTQMKTIIVPNMSDKTKAEKRAKREAEKEKEKSQQGNGQCIGLPQIVPGRYITLGKLDSTIDGSYYVSQVEHSIGADGFVTSFEIGGYK